MPSSTAKPDTGSTADIHRSLGLFDTRIIEHLPEGGLRISHSRWHRKGLPAIELSGRAGTLPAKSAINPWLQLWAPHRLAWWIAILFVIGSACFAAASFASNWPQYCPAVLVHDSVINCVYFIGSIFLPQPHGCSWRKPSTGTWRISLPCPSEVGPAGAGLPGNRTMPGTAPVSSCLPEPYCSISIPVMP